MCFSPCGTRVYAGETSGNIFAWEYPILSSITPALASSTTDIDSTPVVEENEVDTVENGTKTGSVTPALSGDGRGGSPIREETEEGGGEGEKVVDDEGNVLENSSQQDQIIKEDASQEKEDIEMEVDDSKQTAEEVAVGDEATVAEAVAEAVVEAVAEAVAETAAETTEALVEVTDVDMTERGSTVEDPSVSATEEKTVEPVSETLPNPIAALATEGEPSSQQQAEAPVETAAIDVDGDSKMEDGSASMEDASAVGTEAVDGSAAKKSTTKSTEQTNDSAVTAEETPATENKPIEATKPKEPEVPAKMLKYLFQVGCHSGCANCLEISPNGK